MLPNDLNFLVHGDRPTKVPATFTKKHIAYNLTIDIL